MDQADHLAPCIHTESHSSVNICPVFYLNAYLHSPESFRKKLAGIFCDLSDFG